MVGGCHCAKVPEGVGWALVHTSFVIGVVVGLDRGGRAGVYAGLVAIEAVVGARAQQLTSIGGVMLVVLVGGFPWTR